MQEQRIVHSLLLHNESDLKTHAISDVLHYGEGCDHDVHSDC